MDKTDFFDDEPTEDAPEQREEGAGDEQTFLINKEAYPDAKPGDTFSVRVVASHEKELECVVSHEEEKPETPGKEPASESDGEMASLMD